MIHYPQASPSSAVLLCGDEEVHDLAKYWLTAAGLKVASADDGKQAAKLVSDTRVEVLVLDCLPIYVPDLPDLHRLKEGRRLSTVLIPRSNERVEAGVARISGIDVILERPLRREALLTALKVL